MNNSCSWKRLCIRLTIFTQRISNSSTSLSLNLFSLLLFPRDQCCSSEYIIKVPLHTVPWQSSVTVATSEVVWKHLLFYEGVLNTTASHAAKSQVSNKKEAMDMHQMFTSSLLPASFQPGIHF